MNEEDAKVHTEMEQKNLDLLSRVETVIERSRKSLL